MKKASLTFLFLCVNLGVFAQNALIQEIRGDVVIRLPEAASFTPAKVGDRLSQNTVLSTGFRSYAGIQIGHTSITVRPLTCMTLTEIQASADTETLNVRLQAGRVRVDVKPPAGVRTSMSIASPSAVASVRGTSFEFDMRNLYVNDGVVSFMGNRGQVIPVRAGDSSRVEASAKVANQVEIKSAGLFPRAPVGTDTVNRIINSPVRPSIPFTISLTFAK